MRESGWLYGDLSGNVRWKMVEVGKVIVCFSACVCEGSSFRGLFRVILQ